MTRTKHFYLLIFISLSTFSCDAQSNDAQTKQKVAPLEINAETSSKLQNYFQQEANYQHLSGTILIQQNDQVIYSSAFGHSARTSPNRLDTQFDIGSVTKQFTAAAILQLVSQGEFNLQDPINPLLGKDASDQWKKVTVHQLLTHTSGVPSIYQTEQGLELFFPQKEPTTMENLIGKFREAKLLFSPGEEFSYSNSGYLLLAAIIKQATGMSYHAYLEKELFDKYDLTSTSFQPNEKSALPFYGYRNDLLKEAPIYHPSWTTGAGGAYSTVADLSKWLDIIQSEDFLNAELREAYLKKHTRAKYGYGWQFDGETIQHDGGSAGFMSFVSFRPESNTKIVLLTNRGFEKISMYGKSADYVRGLISDAWKILSGEEVKALPEIQEHAFRGTKTFRFADGKSLLLDQASDTSLLVTASCTYPTRLIANTPLTGNTEKEQVMIELASSLLDKKFGKTARHCNGEMKFVCYSGLMRIGMKMMRKQTGDFQSMVPYFVSSHGLIRITGEKGILDMIVYFDEEGLVQGIFEHGFHEHDKEQPMMAYHIGKGKYFIDGLPYAEKPAEMSLSTDAIKLTQLDRSIQARLIHEQLVD